MERDATLFPADENGDALWNVAQQGVDLTDPREVDFAVIFNDEESAAQFAEVILRSGVKVQLVTDEEDEEFPFQVYLHPFMVPSYESITGFEAGIGELAESLGGQNDGWGFAE